ncbi:MAG: PEP-CTERM sorting domain-containing protein [Burkholderiaceae bacterium]
MQLPFVTTSRLRGLAAALLLSSLPLASATAAPITVLFVGNSFTYGDAAGGPNLVMPYNRANVTDLNGLNIGGVPGLFKAFTTERGLSYNVSLETQPGVGIDWHYNNRLTLINQSWDHVVLQSYSTLDGARPGNPASLIQYSGMLANLLYAKNPNVDIHLDATWSRADQTYKPTGNWYGQSIYAMGNVVKAGYNAAAAANPHIDDVIQTGQAWARTWETGLADSNPYDGITPGQIDMWAPEGYHASVYGYYMEALMFFGDITGMDPLSIGYDQVAMDLGISSSVALALQVLASQTLQGVPEPETFALLFVGIAGLAFARRRDKRVA